MNLPLRACLAIVLITACTAMVADASVVFRPKNGKLIIPGEEQTSANAQQLFASAQASEGRGDYKGAIKTYSALVKRYPHDALAAGSAYRKAQLQEQIGDDLKAADSYRAVVENYPRFERFNEAIEAQFRIGEKYMNGKKSKLLGIAILRPIEKARAIFLGIVKTAPYGKYTARAQFNIGRCAEREGNDEGAVAAYQAVVDKYPNEPVAADAQYQIGYIWYKSSRHGVYDAAATKNARTGFEDFLAKHPHSEKAAQAREDLKRLEQKATNDSFNVARFYDKQKNYRAAAIYYNEVIRQQPNSPQSEQAKKRVAELRAKVGDAALQPAIKPGGPTKKSTSEPAAASRGSNPPMRETPPDAAPLPPLPPADADVSLPPPSTMPDSSPASTPSAGSATDSSASPAPSASPGQ
jgi:outer membrane protein assembly factor BamD